MIIRNSDAEYDVAGIGSALLDFTVEADDALLEELGLKKGEMQLIEADRSREIFARLAEKGMDITPGGSAANTIAGIANLGGKGLFYGKVGSDKHGDRYITDTEATGVIAHITRDRSMTGHAITFITPDSERSFATHLGAALTLTADDIDEEGIAASKILHLEGYLFEPPGLKEASLFAIECAKRNDVLVSIDLSDPGLIGRIRPLFDEVVENKADIVFVNEDEARAFTGKEGLKAVKELSTMVDYAIVKMGEAGSIMKSGNEIQWIQPFDTAVANTNGAGDMYAAGVLYGFSREKDLAESGMIGSYVSSLVVAQVGARLSGKIDLSGM